MKFKSYSILLDIRTWWKTIFSATNRIAECAWHLLLVWILEEKVGIIYQYINILLQKLHRRETTLCEDSQDTHMESFTMFPGDNVWVIKSHRIWEVCSKRNYISVPREPELPCVITPLSYYYRASVTQAAISPTCSLDLGVVCVYTVVSNCIFTSDSFLHHLKILL